ncbi:DinB family protein [Neolewinella aurantiaca]|uniref:DinB family protein n=1 Tax=Neolewinella aurantiaca TaxID=2602767 RepID=A0A5C7FF52_9BACT|nr:DinB family protein [Neolewinella aurantiaca]TXF89408.1 DinB family protein [Neolewinella aurantiaca]
MKARSTTELLAALTERTEKNLRIAQGFLAYPNQKLHLRPRPDAWNALECLGHLNFYSAYYLPEIRKQIAASKYKGAQPTFTSSWLGNKFAAGMKPGEKMRKISTPKSANPGNFPHPVGEDELPRFIRCQEETLELLKLAEKVDLTRTKTGTSLTELIRLRLGDTLRVVIYHNWRHIEQAQRALAAK